VHHFRFNMMEGAKVLAFDAFFHVLGIVSLDGRPIIACFEYFRVHRSCPRMISANSLVYLGHDIFGLLSGDAF